MSGAQQDHIRLQDLHNEIGWRAEASMNKGLAMHDAHKLLEVAIELEAYARDQNIDSMSIDDVSGFLLSVARRIVEQAKNGDMIRNLGPG